MQLSSGTRRRPLLQGLKVAVMTTITTTAAATTTTKTQQQQNSNKVEVYISNNTPSSIAYVSHSTLLPVAKVMMVACLLCFEIFRGVFYTSHCVSEESGRPGKALMGENFE